jgi:hypothetical protein
VTQNENRPIGTELPKSQKDRRLKQVANGFDAFWNPPKTKELENLG